MGERARVAKIKWSSGTSGAWSLDTNWSTSSVPGASDTAIISAAGVAGAAYTILIDSAETIGALELDQAEATLDISNSQLSIRKVFDLQTGTVQFDEGVLAGGTIASTGGTFLSTGNGTLSGVTVEGNLLLAGSGLQDNFDVQGRFALEPANGETAGMMTVRDASLDFTGFHTMLIGGTYNLVSGSIVDYGDAVSGRATLVIGSKVDITASGSSALWSSVPYGGSLARDLIETEGTISVMGRGSVLNGTNYGTFINSGTMRVGDAAALDFILGANFEGEQNQTLAHFSNTGTIDVAAGGFLGLELDKTFSNTGVITDAGTLGLGGSFTTAEALSLGLTASGTLALTGSMNNAGKTLSVGAGGTVSALLLDGGAISGGTLVNLGGLSVQTVDLNGYGLRETTSTLANLTVDGPITVGTDVTLSLSGKVTLHGASGSGSGTIALVDTAIAVQISGSQTLTGTTIEALDDGTQMRPDGILLHDPVAGTPTTLTLLGDTKFLGALGINGNFSTSTGQLTGDTVLNDGTLELTAGSVYSFLEVNLINDGTFDVASQNVAVNDGILTNAGTLALSSNAASLVIAGGVNNKAGLVNSGLITIGAGTTLQYGYDNYAISGEPYKNTGTIDVSGGTFVLNATIASSAIGSIKLSEGGLLSLGGGIDNAGNLLALGAGSVLSNVDVTGIITGGTITAASTGATFGLIGSDSTPVDPAYLRGVIFEGPLLLDHAGESLTFESGVSLTGESGSGAESITVTGSGSELNFDTESLANLSVTLGATGKAAEFGAEYISTLTLATSVSITVVGSAASLDEPDEGNLINNGTITDSVAGGTLSIGGIISNSGIMQLASGVTLLLDDASLDNTAAGVITLSGVTLADTNGLNASPGFSASNAGLISGTGTLAASVSNLGTIAAAGGTLTLTGPVDGTGELEAQVNSTLLLEGNVSAGSIARFDGGKSVLGLSPAQFLGQIAGFGPGDTIDLLHEAASSAQFMANSIVVTLTAGGTITLATTSALSGSLSVSSDRHGDSLITYAQATSAHPDALILPALHA